MFCSLNDLITKWLQPHDELSDCEVIILLKLLRWTGVYNVVADGYRFQPKSCFLVKHHWNNPVEVKKTKETLIRKLPLWIKVVLITPDRMTKRLLGCAVILKPELSAERPWSWLLDSLFSSLLTDGPDVKLHYWNIYCWSDDGSRCHCCT